MTKARSVSTKDFHPVLNFERDSQTSQAASEEVLRLAWCYWVKRRTTQLSAGVLEEVRPSMKTQKRTSSA